LAACSIRVSTQAFERIRRIVRNTKSLKFFVFHTQQWCESHPLRQTRSFVFNHLARPRGFQRAGGFQICSKLARKSLKNAVTMATWVPKGPAFQARLRGADAGAAEELPVPLCRGQAVGDADRANRKGDARDIRRQRLPGETLSRAAWSLPLAFHWLTPRAERTRDRSVCSAKPAAWLPVIWRGRHIRLR
jgi:hypothetical protein